MTEIKIPNVSSAQKKGESSFVHHQRSMIKLEWPQQPKSVAIFVQSTLSDNYNLLNGMKHFLIEKMGLKISEGKYTDEDFIIAIGTDGFNLDVSAYFQDREVPPILSLTPNKKGFLSFHELSGFSVFIPQVIRGNCWILPRCRLLVEYRSLQGVERLCVLNDVVVNRDPLSGALFLNCSCNGFCFSQLHGDGVIISTPTGSTAYNKGAGGALVHPLLPVFMMTPICALSLSARPIIFPQTAVLKISLDNSNDLKKGPQLAYFTLDGQKHIRFNPGDELTISVSPYNYQSILMNKSIAEWPVRLAGLMGWNERKHQKALPSGPIKQ